jgi:hypothetical protein
MPLGAGIQTVAPDRQVVGDDELPQRTVIRQPSADVIVGHDRGRRIADDVGDAVGLGIPVLDPKLWQLGQKPEAVRRLAPQRPARSIPHLLAGHGPGVDLAHNQVLPGQIGFLAAENRSCDPYAPSLRPPPAGVETTRPRQDRSITRSAPRSGFVQLRAVPDLAPRVAASQVRYYFAGDFKPVS